MQKYINTVASTVGRPVPGATVLVLTYPGGATATIYSDNGVTAQSNPITTDSNGSFSFYAADGRYSLQITGPGIATRTINDILLEDPVDGGSPGSFTTLTVASTGTLAGSAIQTASSLGASGTAALIGTTAGNVQSDLNARPTNASLSAPGTAANIGTAAGTVQTDIDARPTSSTLAASGGAALVGTIASGTGAVARTVQDKERDRVSVFDFMTTAQIADVRAGTLAQDMTAAIQTALNAGVPLYAPAGTYLIAGTLTGSTLLKLRGDGYDKTIFKKKTATTGHILDILGTTQKNEIEIEAITFDVNGIDSAITAEYVTDFYVRRCKFTNMRLWGVQVGVQLGSDSVIRNTRVFIEECVFDTSSSTYEQVLLLNTQDAYINDCRFVTGTSAIGVGLYQNIDRVAINDCYFSIHNGLYYSLSTNNIRISGSSFISCDAAVKGANQSDNGAFGATFVRNLTIDRCKLLGNTTGIQLGAVYNAEIIASVFDQNQQQAININWGNTPVSNQSQNIKILGCEFRANNTSAVAGAIAAPVAFTGGGGAMYAEIVGCQFWDDQGTPTQLRPIGFSGAFTWSNVTAIGCRLSTYSGALSIDLNGGATLSSVYALDCQDMSATVAAGVSVRDLGTTWYRTGTRQISFATSGDTVTKITAGSANTAILDLERSGASAGGRIAYDGNTEFYTGGTARLRVESSGNTRPSVDNTYNLGTSSFRWISVYSVRLNLTPVTVASLPGSAAAGSKAFVSDATVTTFASIVAGGGTNQVPVYSDGTAWRIG